MEAASISTTMVRAVQHPRLHALGRWLLDKSLNVYAGLVQRLLQGGEACLEPGSR